MQGGSKNGHPQVNSDDVDAEGFPESALLENVEKLKNNMQRVAATY